MDDWRSYPDFAHLFESLLQANQIGDTAYKAQFEKTTGQHIAVKTIRNTRLGFQQPSYQFVSDLADHALLSLDPNRVQRPEGGSPSGDHRVALFTAAGLIEVTPESIAHWNEEVIAGWQRKLQNQSANEKPVWREIMLKLIEFQMQGSRCDLADILQAVYVPPDPNTPAFNLDRLNGILFGNSVPTPAERMGLARAVGLTDDQTSLIETAIDNGQLQLGKRIRKSSFSTLFDDLLSHLRENRITLQELSDRSIPLGGDTPAFAPTTLSNWRTGRDRPSLSAFRGLVRVLERFQNAVSPAAIEQLINASGFSSAELNDATHDIVARINGETRLKPLLASLRNASDLDVPLSQVQDRHSYKNLSSWELESVPDSPSQAHLLELLELYNSILREKGKQELSAEEIQRVMAVGERDREDGLARGFIKRAHEHRPPVTRRIVTPDLDDGRTR
ncbi:MAG TPA: hypothetical protein VHC22_19340 [Pirellulales bacterium]|nr:hypothetical protein [Pirellulales bacterium]